MQIASGKYRFPDDDYLQDNNGAKMLHYDPEQYFKRYYPEHRVSLTVTECNHHLYYLQPI